MLNAIPIETSAFPALSQVQRISVIAAVQHDQPWVTILSPRIIYLLRSYHGIGGKIFYLPDDPAHTCHVF